MADSAGVSSYSVDLGEEQTADWEVQLNSYFFGRAPEVFLLAGEPAEVNVQPELDRFVADVNVMFGDNHELGLLVHAVMVAQGELMQEADQTGAQSL